MVGEMVGEIVREPVDLSIGDDLYAVVMLIQ